MAAWMAVQLYGTLALRAPADLGAQYGGGTPLELRIHIACAHAAGQSHSRTCSRAAPPPRAVAEGGGRTGSSGRGGRTVRETSCQWSLQAKSATRMQVAQHTTTSSAQPAKEMHTALLPGLIGQWLGSMRLSLNTPSGENHSELNDRTIVTASHRQHDQQAQTTKKIDRSVSTASVFFRILYRQAHKVQNILRPAHEA